MHTLILTHADVARLLSMATCIDLMADALAAASKGEAVLPLRQVVRLPDSPNAFALMPALLGDALGAKLITVFPGNDATPYESHIGVVLYFETTNGQLRAIIDASSITAIRTAAVSGLATQHLARKDAGDLALLGGGVQALTHLEAMACVRTLRRVRVWSRSEKRRDDFTRMAKKRLNIDVEPCATAQDAVGGADIICTVTASREPVLHGAWIAPGAHINAVGGSIPRVRELDTAAVARAQLYVDRRESTMAEAGDFLMPRAEGAITDAHIRGELGELVTGAVPGRANDTDVTLFKSLGLAVEDVACAAYLYKRALTEGVGTRVAIGGMREHAH
ncbi:MAG TPA: ornithine cyclodeaminase family protein [Gemmatimonadaceae bacterium]|nr:ornithine cyclodeaminase family protein [Gemmatimonadaceae bacterium]